MASINFLGLAALGLLGTSLQGAVATGRKTGHYLPRPGHGNGHQACEFSLEFTELASKPGPLCTDFANVFNYDELAEPPQSPVYRPGIEVNFYNEMYHGKGTPKAHEKVGVTQGKCYTTKVSAETGDPELVICDQIYTFEHGTILAKGTLDATAGTLSYAAYGGTGKYLGTYGELTGELQVYENGPIDERTEAYKYSACLVTGRAA